MILFYHREDSCCYYEVDTEKETITTINVKTHPPTMSNFIQPENCSLQEIIVVLYSWAADGKVKPINPDSESLITNIRKQEEILKTIMS